ncbi:Z-ring formation inhibitor MciZ [Paenibacillus gansuensis]|uniref:Z-ring formation inhibitor MciZ n=1 Tax=Paenibacillus gansuensis TaxID=306542 RepID=A0ABW5PBS9_9BACL
MKIYVSGQHLSLSGKAWEIRHKLRTMNKQAGPGALLQDTLASLTSAPRAASIKHSPPTRIPLRKI